MAKKSLKASCPIVQALMLNIFKSTSLGFAVKSLTGKAETRDDGMNLVIEGVSADGTVLQEQFEAKFDGKDYPFPGNPFVDTISLRKIDENTWEYVEKKNGREVEIGRVAKSEDGRTLSETMKVKSAIEENATMTLVYSVEATDPCVGAGSINLCQPQKASTATIPCQPEHVRMLASEKDSKSSGDFVEVW